ncbi:hypothetical protein KIH41_16395 [Litoribacter ruber]|uniref:T9SS type A sorting domain-containing protein n=1 Tax=Litoribacter ruber TaxID=702568 RepID=UPI001BD91366|nr:T9SS type A sorting domain-containing protein [Litoribacter ruber]MBT0812868.1 hypothetical protein [Litoribacter ruber]
MMRFLLFAVVILISLQAEAQRITSRGGPVYYIDDENQLWGWGGTGLASGKGDGDVPELLNLDIEIEKIYASSDATLAIDVNGDVWGWGTNYFGKLGIGEEATASTPTQVKFPAKIKEINFLQNTAIALTIDGKIWGWGNNQNNRLNLGEISIQRTPVEIFPETSWKSVKLSSSGFAGVREDGTLWAFNRIIQEDGGWEPGQSLKAVNLENDWKVAYDLSASLAMKEDGSMWSWDRLRTALEGLDPILPEKKFSSFNYSGRYSLIDEEGNLFLFQDGEWMLANEMKWKEVETGSVNLGITNDNEVYTWGWNLNGNLGIGTHGNKAFPFRLELPFPVSSFSSGLDSFIASGEGGNQYIWGSRHPERHFLPDTVDYRLPFPIERKGLTSIQINDRNVTGFDTDGFLYGWGNFVSWDGILGETLLEKTRLSDFNDWKEFSYTMGHSLFLRENGDIYILGDFYPYENNVPWNLRLLKEDSDWYKVSVANNYSILVKRNGEVWVAGQNTFGNLGTGDNITRAEFVLIDSSGVFADIREIRSSGVQTLVILNDGTLWRWGQNIDKHMANTEEIRLTPFQVGTDNDWKEAAPGRYGALYIKEDGTLWASGENVFHLDHRELSDPSEIIQLGEDKDWKHVYTNDFDTNFALKNDGSLWSWGNSGLGRAGNSDAFRDELQLVKFNVEKPLPPVIGDLQVSEMEPGKVTLSTSVENISADSISSRGFIFAQTDNPGFGDNVVESHEGFIAEVEALAPNTTYWFKAFIIMNNSDTVVSEVYSLTTATVLASIAAPSTVNIDITTANVQSEIESEGGAKVLERGFAWSIKPEPSMQNAILLEDEMSFAATLTNLSPDRAYHVWAFVRTEKGLAWSEPLIFNTLDDDLPPIISFRHESKEYFYLEGAYEIQLELADHSKISEAIIKYKGIRQAEDDLEWKGSGNLAEIPSDTLNITYSFEEVNFDELGMVFHVETTDEFDNTSISEEKVIYRTYSSAAPLSYALPHAGVATEDYRLFSVPLDQPDATVSNTLGRDFGEVHEALWRIISLADGELREMSGNERLEMGKAYWLISALNQPLNFVGSVARVTPGDPFQLELEEGWNMISNPYPFDLDWDFVAVTNKNLGDVPSPLGFVGDYYEELMLRPFEGVFVFSPSPKQVVLPVGLGAGSSARLASREDTGWKLSFNLGTPSGLSNNVSALGMLEEAVEGFDRYDLPLMPRMASYVDISFLDKEIVGLPFTRDFVSELEGYSWEFQINSTEEQIDLSWSIDNLKSGQLKLVDLTHGTSYDMAKTNKISTVKGSEFKVTYTSQGEIRGAARLKNIYPNPASSIVHIPFTLQHDAPYEIHIYDSMGKLIDIIGQEIGKAGEHEVLYNVNQLTRGLYQILIRTYGDNQPVVMSKRLIVK